MIGGGAIIAQMLSCNHYCILYACAVNACAVTVVYSACSYLRVGLKEHPWSLNVCMVTKNGDIIAQTLQNSHCHAPCLLLSTAHP